MMTPNDLPEPPLELKDLTPDQYAYYRRWVYNGVGSRTFPINPRDFIFGPAAIEHDARYWFYLVPGLRAWVDKQFLVDCLKLVKQQPKWKRPFYWCIAHVYYLFLRLLGKYAWEKGEKPITKWDDFLTRFYAYYEKHPREKRPPTFQGFTLIEERSR